VLSGFYDGVYDELTGMGVAEAEVINSPWTACAASERRGDRATVGQFGDDAILGAMGLHDAFTRRRYGDVFRVKPLRWPKVEAPIL